MPTVDEHCCRIPGSVWSPRPAGPHSDLLTTPHTRHNESDTEDKKTTFLNSRIT